MGVGVLMCAVPPCVRFQRNSDLYSKYEAELSKAPAPSGLFSDDEEDERA